MQAICKWFFILIIFTSLPVFALEKGGISYDGIDYSKLNASKIRTEADAFWDKYEQTNDLAFLTTATAKYYVLTKINPLDIYSIVQLAKSYGELGNYKYAKSYFNRAISIDKNDPYTNYYYAEFYFKRNNYRKALRYYMIAYDSSYSNNENLNIKIATIYEKFADLHKAKYYYERAYSINSSSGYSKDKIIQLQSILGESK